MKNIALSVIGIGGILALLIIGQNILIPFVYGLILWFLGRYFKNLLNKVNFVKVWVPKWLINTLIFTIIILGIGLISKLITGNISSLLMDSQAYQMNLQKILNLLNNQFDIDLSQEISKSLEDFNYGRILSDIADYLSGALGTFIMIVLYAIFLSMEEASLSGKIKKLFDNEEKYLRVSQILRSINDSTADYIRLKTYISLLTGIVGYIFLLIMGVDAPFFWAFLMFALNYIPTIGSLIATLFPALFSLVQFGDFKPFLILLIGLGIIQALIGNVLEPRIMGKSLNLSPLVTILALVVGGQIWGITGMLLSTPITVVIVIIFSQFKSTEGIAIMLSENGAIKKLS